MQAGAILVVHYATKLSHAKLPSHRWVLTSITCFRACWCLSSLHPLHQMSVCQMISECGRWMQFPFHLCSSSHRSHLLPFWKYRIRCWWVKSCGAAMILRGWRICLPEHSLWMLEASARPPALRRLHVAPGEGGTSVTSQLGPKQHHPEHGTV